MRHCPPYQAFQEDRWTGL